MWLKILGINSREIVKEAQVRSTRIFFMLNLSIENLFEVYNYTRRLPHLHNINRKDCQSVILINDIAIENSISNKIPPVRSEFFKKNSI